jgi:hypothetical protein
MRVQGCGDDVLDSPSLTARLRLTRTHTPVQSYLSTPLRFGRDDGWEVCPQSIGAAPLIFTK